MLHYVGTEHMPSQGQNCILKWTDQTTVFFSMLSRSWCMDLKCKKLHRRFLRFLKNFRERVSGKFQGPPDITPKRINIFPLKVPSVETTVSKNILNLFVNSARSQNFVNIKCWKENS